MKKRILQIIGIILILATFGGLAQKEFVPALLCLVIGIILLIKSKDMKAPSKEPKKEWHSFECEVKGHFLHDRQRVLSRAFRDHYNKEIDRADETQISNCIELVPEPENEYDPNAIAIHIRPYGMIGYIPKDQTQELKENINLDNEFRSYLTIYKDQKEYFADLQIQQKY